MSGAPAAEGEADFDHECFHCHLKTVIDGWHKAHPASSSMAVLSGLVQVTGELAGSLMVHQHGLPQSVEFLSEVLRTITKEATDIYKRWATDEARPH